MALFLELVGASKGFGGNAGLCLWELHPQSGVIFKFLRQNANHHSPVRIYKCSLSSVPTICLERRKLVYYKVLLKKYL